MARNSRAKIRHRVHTRIRKRVTGTAERPRLAVFRSSKHIYAQVIDDGRGVTLAAASTTEPESRTSLGNGSNVKAAQEIGRLIAERAKQQGIESVVFDRGGYIYHGRVRALAESAREGGLQF